MSTDPQVSVSARSLESLDFPRILSLFGALAATDVGRLRVASLRPVRGEELARRRAELTELADILSEGTLVAALDEPITELWEELNGSRPDLDGRKLVRWSRVLATARLAVETLDEARPALHAIVRDLPDLGWLEERIQGTLDERGDVRDDASPALQKLRRRIARLRKTTYARLQETLDERGEVFSQDTIPFHNGRLVLMLRSGERGRGEGLVHGSSASGRSL